MTEKTLWQSDAAGATSWNQLMFDMDEVHMGTFLPGCSEARFN